MSMIYKAVKQMDYWINISHVTTFIYHVFGANQKGFYQLIESDLH